MTPESPAHSRICRWSRFSAASTTTRSGWSMPAASILGGAGDRTLSPAEDSRRRACAIRPASSSSAVRNADSSVTITVATPKIVADERTARPATAIRRSAPIWTARSSPSIRSARRDRRHAMPVIVDPRAIHRSWTSHLSGARDHAMHVVDRRMTRLPSARRHAGPLDSGVCSLRTAADDVRVAPHREIAALGDLLRDRRSDRRSRRCASVCESRHAAARPSCSSPDSRCTRTIAR